jgi:hypothetical protein
VFWSQVAVAVPDTQVPQLMLIMEEMVAASQGQMGSITEAMVLLKVDLVGRLLQVGLVQFMLQPQGPVR